MTAAWQAIRLDESFSRIDESALRAVEQRLQVSLPADYRDFLLQVNGGIPSVSEFDTSLGNVRACIDCLYGVSARREKRDLESEQQQMQDRTGGSIPDGFITIGFDPGSAPFFIGTKGESRGKIYLYDQDGFMDANRQPKLHLVASSFTDLMERLRKG